MLFLPYELIIKSVLINCVHVADTFPTCFRGTAHRV